MNATPQPQRDNPRVLFVALLATSVLLGAAYTALFLSIERAQSDIDERAGAVEGKLLRQNSLVSSKTTAAQTATLRVALDRFAIAPDGVVPFLNSLQRMGAEQRLKVTILSVDIGAPAESPEVFETVSVSLQTAGRWQDVYRFAALSELLPLKVTIRRADLQREESQGNEKSGTPREPSASALWRGIIDIDVLKLKQS